MRKRENREQLQEIVIDEGTRKLFTILYNAKYKYELDTDPKLLELLPRRKRKAIHATVDKFGEGSLTQAQREKWELLKRYENNKFNGQWFTDVLSTVQVLAMLKLFRASARRSIGKTNGWFFNESTQLIEELTPRLQGGVPTTTHDIDRAEQLLDLAFTNLFPMKSRTEMENILGITPHEEGVTK